MCYTTRSLLLVCFTHLYIEPVVAKLLGFFLFDSVEVEVGNGGDRRVWHARKVAQGWNHTWDIAIMWHAL